MPQDLKPGSRWRSTVSETEVVVVRTPTRECVLGCGGAEMVPLGPEGSPETEPGDRASGSTELGKRYEDRDTGLELLSLVIP